MADGYIVTVSGAQGVGKTTLIEALEKYGWEVYKSFVREESKKNNLKVNDIGDDKTQFYILNKHLERLNLNKDNRNIILDRSLIDVTVYTKYLHELGRVKDSTLNIVEDSLKNNFHKYDRMFYIAPEFEIVNDGFRSLDKNFQNKIDDLFKYYIDKFNIDIVQLTGSVENRVKQFLDSINRDVTTEF